MANVGDNFIPESSALTSQALDGRSNASLDYFEESMNGFFERLNEKLSQAGINLPLPQLDFFDSGNSSGSQQGGERGGFPGGGSSGAGAFERGGGYERGGDHSPQCEDEQESYEPGYGSDSDSPNQNSTSERLPYNRKELGAQILQENFDDVDLDGDGFLRAGEIRQFKQDLNGKLEKSSVGQVLDDIEAVRGLSNDQAGREVGISREDLGALQQKIQRRGEFRGYPSDR